MSEITDSIAESIKKRTTSITLGTYVFFWAAYHWQGLYVALFIDENLIIKKYDLLKNEYLERYFFGIDSVYDWRFYLGYIVPGLLTFVFIWLVPKHVLIHAYRQEQEHKVNKRIIKIEEEKRIKKDEESLARQTEKTVDAEIKATSKKREAARRDPKILWKREFENLSGEDKHDLREILTCVYEHKGNVFVGGQFVGSPEFELDPNALRFGDSRDLVRIVDSGKRIELSEKGKYFASLYEDRL